MDYQEIMREYANLRARCAGKSVDELLAISNGNEIEFIQAIEMAIQQKSERVGEHGLSEEERIVLAVEALEREVNNGGYSQFFTNSSGEYAPIIVDSLSRIGCNETARITKKAIDILGIQELSPEALESIFVSENDVRDDELDECDQLYYGTSENILGKLIDFIKANKNVIQP
ncbi:MAG: DMP19 family protein [Terracidiphilus sp.]